MLDSLLRLKYKGGKKCAAEITSGGEDADAGVAATAGDANAAASEEDAAAHFGGNFR